MSKQGVSKRVVYKGFTDERRSVPFTVHFVLSECQGPTSLEGRIDRSIQYNRLPVLLVSPYSVPCFCPRSHSPPPPLVGPLVCGTLRSVHFSLPPVVVPYHTPLHVSGLPTPSTTSLTTLRSYRPVCTPLGTQDQTDPTRVKIMTFRDRTL